MEDLLIKLYFYIMESEEDAELENDLKEQVSRNLRQSEIVDFMRVKYPMYSAVSIILGSGTLTTLLI